MQQRLLRAFRVAFALQSGIMRMGLVGLAQLVRASDCGPEGRRFKPDIPPHIVQISASRCFFDVHNREEQADFAGSTLINP